jgi:pyruvate kinase
LPSPGIIRWKPLRNEFGQVTCPANIAFCSENHSSEDEAVAIPVKGSIFKHAQPGDTIELTDARGLERALLVVETDPASCVCTNDRTGYVIQGTKLRLIREKKLLYEDEVATLPEVEHALSLSVGDDLVLTPVEVLGKPAEYEEDEAGYQPAQIGCSLSAVLTDAKPEQRIFFDDGKIGGIIHAIRKGDGGSQLQLKITHAAKGTAKLRPEKGINLPDTKLSISPLTAKDRADLEIAAEHGDLISLFCPASRRRGRTDARTRPPWSDANWDHPENRKSPRS